MLSQFATGTTESSRIYIDTAVESPGSQSPLVENLGCAKQHATLQLLTCQPLHYQVMRPELKSKGSIRENSLTITIENVEQTLTLTAVARLYSHHIRIVHLWSSPAKADRVMWMIWRHHQETCRLLVSRF